jgi:hypothetical protein
VADDRILDSYQRASVQLPGLRRARVTVGGLPVWMVHPLPPERQPFASWRRLRAAHDQTGLWPFLAGMDLKEVDRQALSELWYQAATNHDPTAVQRGLALDVQAFFAEQTTELEAPDPATLALDAATLAWAEREPQFAFTSRDTVIGLIPARHGWEVPGLLSWHGRPTMTWTALTMLRCCATGMSGTGRSWSRSPATRSSCWWRIRRGIRPRSHRWPSRCWATAQTWTCRAPARSGCWPMGSARIDAGRFGGTDLSHLEPAGLGATRYPPAPRGPRASTELFPPDQPTRSGQGSGTSSK